MIINLLSECYKQYLSAVKHHADWLDPTKTGSSKMAASLYRSSLNDMSHYLTKSIVEFDMFAIVLGIFTIFIVSKIILLFFRNFLLKLNACSFFRLFYVRF